MPAHLNVSFLFVSNHSSCPDEPEKLKKIEKKNNKTTKNKKHTHTKRKIIRHIGKKPAVGLEKTDLRNVFSFHFSL